VTGRSGGTARPTYLGSDVGTSGAASGLTNKHDQRGSGQQHQDLKGLGASPRACSMSSWKERHTARYSSFDNTRTAAIARQGLSVSSCRPARTSRSPRTFEAAHPPGMTLLVLPGHQLPTSWSTRRRTVGGVLIGVLIIVVERLPLGCRVRGSDRIMRSTRDVRRANSAVRRRARAQTRSRRSGAASAERRRWPCWRRCGLVSRGERRGSPGRPGRVRRG
jgi:hypothetical protein